MQNQQVRDHQQCKYNIEQVRLNNMRTHGFGLTGIECQSGICQCKVIGRHRRGIFAKELHSTGDCDCDCVVSECTQSARQRDTADTADTADTVCVCVCVCVCVLQPRSRHTVERPVENDDSALFTANRRGFLQRVASADVVRCVLSDNEPWNTPARVVLNMKVASVSATVVMVFSNAATLTVLQASSTDDLPNGVLAGAERCEMVDARMRLRLKCSCSQSAASLCLTTRLCTTDVARSDVECARKDCVSHAYEMVGINQQLEQQLQQQLEQQQLLVCMWQDIETYLIQSMSNSILFGARGVHVQRLIFRRRSQRV
jgi:hypothetical protein